MGSHRRPDDGTSTAYGRRWSRGQWPDGEDGAPTSDHFGLFDDAADEPDAPEGDERGDVRGPSRDRSIPPDAAPHHTRRDGARAEESSAEGDEPEGDDAVDLSQLKEVLAGRRTHAESAASPPATVPPRRRRAPRRRHRVRSTIIALLVMILIAGGAVAGVIYWRTSTEAPTDWAGTGAASVIVRVQSGDGLFDVGQTLVSAGVVASAETFASVAAEDGRLRGLQPGYYRVHEHSASQVVVNELADPKNRLGQLRVVPGQTLADTTTVSTAGKTSVKRGIMSAIADACVPTDGAESCFTVDELWKVEETANLSDLGVVGWAVADVANAPDPHRRLEGMILPGDYVIRPGSTAQQALSAVVQASAAAWNTTGIVASAKRENLRPYELATVASLVQAEGIGPDMRKVARVIYNRLADGMKLQFDSTVNYGLGRAQISTSKAERLDATNLYSTYAHAGLTPTPIGAPGPQALDAADDPATGSWLYFVATDLDGHSCFSTTAEQHEQCVAEARKNGVFG